MWYIMDEFGSRVRQSCDPTVSMVAFFFIPTQLAFSVMWPTKDLEYTGKNYNGWVIAEDMLANASQLNIYEYGIL
jgi:hypothetical protein